MKKYLITLGCLFVASFFAAEFSPLHAQPSPVIQKTGGQSVLRATMGIRGVFSPRGFFNIEVRLDQLKGLNRYKFDLRDSLAILDFKPGVSVSSSTLQEVMIKAGYRPGPVQIEELPLSRLKDGGRGWMSPPKADSRWAFIRWLELNF